MTNAQQNTNSSPGLLERQGIQGSLKWGFLAVMIFMAGNSLELGFISVPAGQGTVGQPGERDAHRLRRVVAVASWLSGALADSWRPRRVMLTGFVLWLIFEVIFLAGGVATGSYLVMIISYALRGVGYPLFAYGFLVWITMATPEERLGRATGWFWFSVALGQGVIAGYVPSLLIPVIGEVTTLWLSVAFVVVGGVMALLLLKPENTEGHEQRPSAAETIAGSPAVPPSWCIVRRSPSAAW